MRSIVSAVALPVPRPPESLSSAIAVMAGKHINKAGTLLLFTIDAPSHTASTPPPTTSHLTLGFCLETLHEFSLRNISSAPSA